MDDKGKIFEFLKSQFLGVVSTIDSKSDKPESAVVSFVENENLEIVFGTFNDTRKLANIEKNPNAAFVIGWKDITIQYEGIAKITQGEEMENCRTTHLAKNPASKKYAFHEKQRFIKIKPRWIRYSDFSYDPEKVFEINF